MSKFMLKDEDAINDVNPFVTRDFSLPGGVRQTGGYDSFSKPTPVDGIVGADESVYCDYALCETAKGPSTTFTEIHPRRNIDPGFTCKPPPKSVKVGVSQEQRVPYGGIAIIVASIALVLLYSKRLWNIRGDPTWYTPR